MAYTHQVKMLLSRALSHESPATNDACKRSDEIATVYLHIRTYSLSHSRTRQQVSIPPGVCALMQARSVLPGGCTKGELTRPGQLQSRELGQWLRQRYVQKLQFLSPQYQACPIPPVGGITGFRGSLHH